MNEIGTFEQLMEFEEIRDVITIPRNIPRRNREEIAYVLFKEIVQGENFEIRDRGRFIEKFGAFYLIFISLKGSEGWERLKRLSQKQPGIVIVRAAYGAVEDPRADGRIFLARAGYQAKPGGKRGACAGTVREYRGGYRGPVAEKSYGRRCAVYQ